MSAYGTLYRIASERGDAEATLEAYKAFVDAERRHLDDTALVVVGDDALSWMTQAQAFAGPPTDPPVPKGITLD